MTGELEPGAMVEGYWQGKTEILGEKPVSVPLSLKLPEGTEDNHKNFSQYIYIYMYVSPPPHQYIRLLQGYGRKKICQTLTAYPSGGNYTMTTSEILFF